MSALPVPTPASAAEREWELLAGRAPRLAATASRYLEQIGLSLRPSSVVVADGALRLFVGYLVEHHPHTVSFASVGRPEIEAFKVWLTRRRTPKGTTLSANTIRQRLGTLRTFFDRIIEWDWADAPARTPIFGADLPVADEPSPRFLDDAQAARLLRAAAADPDPLRRLVVEMLARTGLRVSELCDLEADAVVRIGEGWWLRVGLGKLHNDRYVPLHPQLVEQLAGRSGEGPWLLMRNGAPLNRHVVTRMLRRVAARAGIGHVHPHQLRHTLATQAKLSTVASDASFDRVECPATRRSSRDPASGRGGGRDVQCCWWQPVSNRRVASGATMSHPASCGAEGGIPVTGAGVLAGSARLVLVDGAIALRPEAAMFEAILDGWRLQQESRFLAAPTVESRDKTLRRFQEFTGDYPWRWGPGDIEEWSVSLRSAGRSRTTIRAYQNAVAMFCDFVCDGRYGWATECEARFGEHPSQICHDWNTADHVADYEGDPARRPFTREELQGFFDFADERVAAARAHGRKGGLAAWRDTALFKVTYAWGLRRREAAMLDVADFSTNPAAPELGRFGMLSVRWGKAMRGSPPRRRNVATVMPWAVEVVEEYLAEVRPLYGSDTSALWLTERGGRISARHINERFCAYREAMGLPAELTPHCLRHSYVSHLVEDGVDPLFVQQQVGHSWASTTAIYTSVSGDYKNKVMRDALARAFAEEDR